MRPSADGALLALNVRNLRNVRPFEHQESDYTNTGVPQSAAGGEVWIVDPAKGTTIKLIDGQSSGWGPSWSPDGRRLAFYSDRDGATRLWLWDRATGRVRRVSDAIVRPTEGDSESPLWMPGGRTIFSKLLPANMSLQDARTAARHPPPPDTGKTDAVTVSILSPDKPVNVMPKFNRMLGDFALIDAAGGEVQRFVERIRPWYYSLSPDGVYAAASTWDQADADGLANGDLIVYSVPGGAKQFAIEDILPSERFLWSPGGQTLAYSRSGAIEYPFQDHTVTYGLLDLKSSRPLSLKDKLPKDMRWGEVYWSAVGESLYNILGQEAWLIPVGGNGAAVRLQLPEGAAGVHANPDGTVWHPKNSRALLVRTENPETGRSGYGLFDPSSGRHRRLFDMGADKELGSIVPMSEDGSYLYTVSDVGHFSDVWIYRGRASRSTRLTQLNPEWDSYEMGASRLIEWQTRDGNKLSGALLLPSGYQPGRRYPMAVWVYGNLPGSAFLKAPGFWGDQGVQFNFQALATRGYAVFFPEAPQRIGTPMKDLADAVLSGIDKAVELGIADPGRLAIMGQSYGGYCVQALLVQTDRFKAAIASASVGGNFFSMYGYGKMEENGFFQTWWMEKGQALLQGSPWTQQRRYLENSPFFSYDRVKTPLLMQEGMNDFLLKDNEETYIAYAKLGHDVEYLRYYGEGHAILGYSNNVDFWRRRIEFLDKHLMPRDLKP